MKKLIMPILLIIIFTACEDKKVEAEQKEVLVKPKEEIKIKSKNMDIVDESSLYSYDIDGNRVLRLAYDGEETQTTKQLAGLATVKNSYEGLSDEILSQTMSRNFIVKCSSCHNRYANGVVGPSLLNKSAKEISSMIEAYKEGNEKNVLMQYLVSQMDKEEIDSLAQEIAKLNEKVREKKQ